jgi:hypothetical protein
LVLHKSTHEVKLISEQYNFKKFWEVYTRQNRCNSKWDGDRTDMDVFIRRTLSSWFAGKCFQIEIERHHKHFHHATKEYKIFTKYICITNITFAYAPYHDKINIYYIEPNSEKIEVVCYGYNELIGLKLVENEEDFRILKKFYPIVVEKYVLPTLGDLAARAMTK